MDGLDAVGQLGKRAAAEATGMSEGTVSKKAKVRTVYDPVHLPSCVLYRLSIQ